MKPGLWVHYKVEGKPYKAGPYTEETIEAQRSDIALYGFVTDIVVGPEHMKDRLDRVLEDPLGE